jgi:hypothetical protein
MQRVRIVTRSRLTLLSRANHALQVANRSVSRRWRSANVAEFGTKRIIVGNMAALLVQKPEADALNFLASLGMSPLHGSRVLMEFESLTQP